MGCDTESPELDLVEFLNSLPQKHAVVFNRDLLTPMSYQYLREYKLGSSCVFSVEKNAAGYSRDVHGQLNVSQDGGK